MIEKQDFSWGAKGGSRPFHSKAIPPFASLRAFVSVGREGGIRKAALALGLDHAVVSRHVRALEDWLGAPLFQRAGGQLRFTKSGARYYARVADSFLELAAATTEAMEHEEQRNLRLWCVPGFATQWLAHRLAEFERLSPEYQVELRPTDSRADLTSYEADIDVRFYGDSWLPEPGGKDLKYIELARPELMVVASPELAGKLSGLRSVADIVGPLLLHEEHDEQWREWLQRNNFGASMPLPGQRLWHAHLAIAAARLGRGVALANRFLVGEDLARGALVEMTFPDAGRVVMGAYCFVARKDRWSLPAVANLRRFLASKAAE